ncbi:MAG: IclR family transcriptional regulator [Acidimicrobiales bacterium]
MEARVSDVGVVDKAMAILGVLETGPATLSEVAASTRLARATAHRLLVSLEAHGTVRRDGGGRFALGFRLVALGRAAADGVPLALLAEPALRWLRDETGESVQLYVRHGEHRVCVAALDGSRELRTIVAVGARLPLDRGSAGKVLRGEARAERRGWAESVAEREAGVASVSAPVHGTRGEVVAAISVSGPIERTSRQPGRRYAAAVVEAARRVEAAAGPVAPGQRARERDVL